jgi:hypothetical protein
MGYMGFGMRKEVYQKKPKQISNKIIRASDDPERAVLKRERLNYKISSISLGLRIFRAVIYKIVPVLILLYVIYRSIIGW